MKCPFCGTSLEVRPTDPLSLSGTAYCPKCGYKKTGTDLWLQYVLEEAKKGDLLALEELRRLRRLYPNRLEK